MFDVDRDDRLKLVSIINDFERLGIQTAQSTVKQASLWFAQSAAKATKPGSASTISRMTKKHKFRKVVTISKSKQVAAGKNFYFNTKTGAFFETHLVYPVRWLRDRDLVRVTKFLEAIKRSTGKKYLIPVDPRKGRPEEKDRKIPKAGAGKMGWRWTAIKLGKRRKSSAGDVNQRVNTTKSNLNSDDPYVIIANNVDYVRKTSPDSARIGLKKTQKRLGGLLRAKAAQFNKLGRL